MNDYLARRDADWMRPIYEALGDVGGRDRNADVAARAAQVVRCDITYGTAKEFGFDFLRDRLLLRKIGEGQTDFLGGMLGMNANSGSEKPGSSSVSWNISG